MPKRLATLCHKIYAHRTLRIVIATIFSIGKVLSSAGGTLFGVKETLMTYGVNGPATIGLPIGLTALNAVLTTANRAPPIYRKLLKNSPATPPVPATATPSDAYRALPGLPEMGIDQQLITQPATSIHVNPRDPGALSITSKWLYYIIISLCYLSLPFSALNAYLSAITLVDEIYPDVDSTTRLCFAYFVTASSMMSYCTFNLAKMRRNVLRMCTGIDARRELGTYNLSRNTLIATVFSTVFGIIAGVGTAYLGTNKSLDLFPPTQNFTPDTKEGLIISSVIASLFSSVFIFAVSCYDRIRAHLEPHSLSPDHFPIPLYAKCLTLIDSVSNSATGFIGVINLIDRILDHRLNRVALVLMGLVPLINNIFMNYALGLVGSQPTLEWLHSHCCRIANRPLDESYLTPESYEEPVRQRETSHSRHSSLPAPAQPAEPCLRAHSPQEPPVALPASPSALIYPPEQTWRAYSPQGQQSAFFWDGRAQRTERKDQQIIDHPYEPSSRERQSAENNRLTASISP